jgi:Protein of unknown function (DUF3761)
MTMRTIRQLFSAATIATVLAFSVAHVPVDAQTRPKDATGQCKDGTFTKAQTKRGACSQHGGVTTWFADEKATPAPTSKAAPPAEKETAPVPSKPSAGKAATPTAGKAAIVKPPAGTPDNATAKCKDNTYSFAKTHSGACSHHGGVAEWYK